MALVLAFCKHSKVGEYLNICKNALSNLTGRDKASHTKKTTTRDREGSADTAKGVQQVQSREYFRLEDFSDHNYSFPVDTNPKEEQAWTSASTAGSTRKMICDCYHVWININKSTTTLAAL